MYNKGLKARPIELIIAPHPHIQMTRNPDWIDIPTFEFEIRGLDGSRLRFATASVLAMRVVVTGVVNLNATLTLCAPESTFEHSFQFADYNGLRRFRDGLRAVRQGSTVAASLAGEGFSLTIGMHDSGPRDGLVVEGQCYSIHDLSYAPWPAGQSAADFVLQNRRSLGCLRFAFLSSAVDPPHLDHTIAGIDPIIGYLESEGFQP